MAVAEPCSCSVAVDERAERRLEMLAELADVGLDLAKAVAAHVKAQLASANDGWTFHMPKDPSAAFARLAQTVRRTLALEVHLREGLEARRTSLFASPPRRGIDLNPPPEVFAAALRDREIQSRVELTNRRQGPGACNATSAACWTIPSGSSRSPPPPPTDRSPVSAKTWAWKCAVSAMKTAAGWSRPTPLRRQAVTSR
jgi:hypothetical protein